MPYLPQHTFEPYHEDGAPADYCGIPDGEHICAKHADHPIHNTMQPGIEKLARHLAMRKWNDRDWSVHARHSHSSDCALCTKDIHAIAKAALDFFPKV